jgi:hypothetical protein
VPQRRIAMYLDAIGRIVSTATMLGHNSLEWPAAFAM